MTTDHLPTVTSVHRGYVMLAGSHFEIHELLFSEYVDRISGTVRPASSEIHLTGVRGATYLLRGFLYRGGAVDTGLRQVISLKSGQPFRKGGNEVRVTVIGDVIEEAR